jgi:nicotinamidase-related amidase
MLYGQMASAARTDSSYTLTLQTRTADNRIQVADSVLEGHKTALIVVDMWDRHWCKTFTTATADMVPGMNKVLTAARKLGIQVIFAPSDVTAFYKDKPQYQAVKQFPAVPLRVVRPFNPPYAPWSVTGGCECSADRPCQEKNVWTRQHKDLIITAEDLITDKAEEINNICRQKGISTLLYAGVASNMCVTRTRSFSVVPMTRYGYHCVVIRDLTKAISGNGYDPDLKKAVPGFTPEHASEVVTEHIEKYMAPTISGNQLLIQAGMPAALEKHTEGPSMFTPEAVAAYIPKGPTRSFRQLCYDYNWVGRTLSDLPLKFGQASPVEYAALSKKGNLDAALVLAVPHHGYTTYNSRYGVKFPAIKGDWFGEVVKELHARNISAIGYITLGTNWKFMRNHTGEPFIHAKVQSDGHMDMNGLCLNAPGYTELVENYTREILKGYPVDGLRYDMLFSPLKCDCAGCRRFYEEYYGEPFTDWATITAKDSTRAERFNIATLSRIATRVLTTGKALKPSVEMWQNHVNTDAQADINLGRKFDIAYIEFGSPFRLLALKGILNKNAIIVGQTLKSPIRRLMMALGARCYQYIPVNQETALPDDRSWVENDLSQFFKMVSQVQPYLEDAHLPSRIGVVFNENTRYHFPHLSRAPYMKVCEDLTLNYLNSSCPLRFINVLDLDSMDLSAYKLLLLPRSSGFTAGQLQRLKAYAGNGGQLLISGDALLYDEAGKPLPAFALGTEMGIGLKNTLPTAPAMLAAGIRLSGKGKHMLGKGLPDSLKIAGLTEVTVQKGQTIASLRYGNRDLPLVHVTPYGKGNMIYVANAGDERLIRAVADHFSGQLPVNVSGPAKQVIVAAQEQQHRKVIHLISDGEYEVRISKDMAPSAEVLDMYPKNGWEYAIREHKNELVISVKGNATDRLLVLKDKP